MKGVEKFFRPHVFFLLAGVLQHCLICVQKVSISSNGDDELRYGVDDGSKLRFGFGYFVESPGQHRLITSALNRNRSEMRNLPDDLLILLTWTARLAPIDRECAQHQPTRGQYRR